VGVLLTLGCQIDRSGLPEDTSGQGASDGGRPEDGSSPGQPSDGGSCDDCGAARFDQDDDGIPAQSDCDDSDPSIGTTAERACEGECGSGIERCVMGDWEPCDAPTDCECMPGEERTRECGHCGMQSQQCNEQGVWQDVGECSDQGSCMPGAEDRESQSCGRCGSGSHTRTRTCDETCTWESWSGWSLCAGETGCVPGATEQQTESCGCDGTHTRSRECSDACTWGSWGEWSSCTGGNTNCIPGATWTETRSCGECDNGTQERARSCTDECSWTSWGDWGDCENTTVCEVEGSDLCPGESKDLFCDRGSSYCTCESDGTLDCIGSSNCEP
jgi:hypothetical protein